MSRNQKFSREQLQAAALALVEKEGLEGLSMRNLALALGTGAMTIYNYVADRAELEGLLVEAVMQEVRWSGKPSKDWRADVKEITHAMWAAARKHPQIIPLVVTRRSSAAAFLGPTEALLDALKRGGLKDQNLLIAFRTVSGFVTGIAQAELTGPLAASAQEDAKDVIARFESLPREKYPRLLEIAKAAGKSKPEKEFTTGLNIIITGLEKEFGLESRD
ncbi:MAG: TetR/AcrR family transcriptional regulator [Spirochaetia bacterium]|nr:TetR/AcrR family transcriptional regulator [Spirochaetia bacterium]